MYNTSEHDLHAITKVQVCHGSSLECGSGTPDLHPYPPVPVPLTHVGYPYPCHCLNTVHSYRTHLYLNEKKHSACVTSSSRISSSSSCAFIEAIDYSVLVMDNSQGMTGFMPEVAATNKKEYTPCQTTSVCVFFPLTYNWLSLHISGVYHYVSEWCPSSTEECEERKLRVY